MSSLKFLFRAIKKQLFMWITENRNESRVEALNFYQLEFLFIFFLSKMSSFVYFITSNATNKAAKF